MPNELELLSDVDFLIREQALLLNQFEGLDIDSTCGGHIRTEEWIPYRDREGFYKVLYYFIIGLKRVINRKEEGTNPEKDPIITYEYYGQEIDREVFRKGIRKEAHEFMFLPFDDIHGHLENPKIQGLYFDCTHLYFSNFDVSKPNNQKLLSGLLNLYKIYEKFTDLVMVPGCFPGFRIDNLEFRVGNRGSVRSRFAAGNGGSVNEYLRSAIQQCLDRQTYSIQLWEGIGDVCKEILSR